jgi:hypothetical protein
MTRKEMLQDLAVVSCCDTCKWKGVDDHICGKCAVCEGDCGRPPYRDYYEWRYQNINKCPYCDADEITVLTMNSWRWFESVKIASTTYLQAIQYCPMCGRKLA